MFSVPLSLIVPIRSPHGSEAVASVAASASAPPAATSAVACNHQKLSLTNCVIESNQKKRTAQKVYHWHADFLIPMHSSLFNFLSDFSYDRYSKIKVQVKESKLQVWDVSIINNKFLIQSFL